MTVQDARIAEFCEQLKLIRLASEWPGLAQDAAKTEASFADFLEKLLECEMLGRDERRRATLTRLATMPSIKTLEQFDWSHAPGGSEGASSGACSIWPFLHRRAENIVLLGPERRWRTHIALLACVSGGARRQQGPVSSLPRDFPVGVSRLIS